MLPPYGLIARVSLQWILLIFIATSRRFVLKRQLVALILYSGNGASKLQWEQEDF